MINIDGKEYLEPHIVFCSRKFILSLSWVCVTNYINRETEVVCANRNAIILFIFSKNFLFTRQFFLLFVVSNCLCRVLEDTAAGVASIQSRYLIFLRLFLSFARSYRNIPNLAYIQRMRAQCVYIVLCI